MTDNIVKVPALADLVPEVFFTTDNPDVSFVYVDPRLRRMMAGLPAETIADDELQFRPMGGSGSDSDDGPLIEKFGGTSKVTYFLAHVASLLLLQPRGEEGTLSVKSSGSEGKEMSALWHVFWVPFPNGDGTTSLWGVLLYWYFGSPARKGWEVHLTYKVGTRPKGIPPGTPSAMWRIGPVFAARP